MLNFIPCFRMRDRILIISLPKMNIPQPITELRDIGVEIEW